jgi:hypothetical protein
MEKCTLMPQKVEMWYGQTRRIYEVGPQWRVLMDAPDNGESLLSEQEEAGG